MKKIILYIHGKGGNAAEVERYKEICPQFDVYGLDYRGNTPWDTKDEIIKEYDRLTEEYDSVILIANSIGAFFAMNALQSRDVEKALFISPIVDMEKLISDMMLWSGVNEQQLCEKGEIPTDLGETLSWKYLQYVRNNKITWTAPTEILYAGRDTLTSRETVESFCRKNKAGLTVMEDGEHWFHTEEQLDFLDEWVKMYCKYKATEQK